jgi:hypothetical protein
MGRDCNGRPIVLNASTPLLASTVASRLPDRVTSSSEHASPSAALNDMDYHADRSLPAGRTPLEPLGCRSFVVSEKLQLGLIRNTYAPGACHAREARNSAKPVRTRDTTAAAERAVQREILDRQSQRKSHSNPNVWPRPIPVYIVSLESQFSSTIVRPSLSRGETTGTKARTGVGRPQASTIDDPGEATSAPGDVERSVAPAGNPTIAAISSGPASLRLT